MRALIRFVSRGPGGAALQRDRIFDGDVITLGRATDQVINLKDRRVELEHARIVRVGGRCLVSSRALRPLLSARSRARQSSHQLAPRMTSTGTLLILAATSACCTAALASSVSS